MSYVLIYAVEGHELSSEPLASINEVNAEIRSLYDQGGEPATVLRIEEHHDGPRTWQIEYPPAPPAGTRFRTKVGRVLEVGPDGRVMVGMTSWSWKGVLEDGAPLTEVVETEVEAAARRLREADFVKNFSLGGWYADDIRTVLAHVLNGGTLPEVK